MSEVREGSTEQKEDKKGGEGKEGGDRKEKSEDVMKLQEKKVEVKMNRGTN